MGSISRTSLNIKGNIF